jgi:RsiW-degrading membrane proteinase PrsW (M82 family)
MTQRWGTLAWHGKRISARQLVFWTGAGFWVLLLLWSTGPAGIRALRNELVFLAGLIVLSSATRSVNIREVASLFFLGGFTMGLAYLLSPVLPSYPLRDFVAPPIEEFLKIAPVLYVLWRWRTTRTWTLGVTDVLLMAAASGAGFSLVEDAFIRGSPGVSWLPTTVLHGNNLDAGHAIWTAVAGATIGFALFFREKKVPALALGASGFVVAVFDHIQHNYGVDSHGAFERSMQFVAGNGWAFIDVFVVLVVAAVLFDLYVTLGTLPRVPELKLPPFGGNLENLKAQWAFLVGRRALAYLLFRYRRASGPARAKLARLAAMLDQSLVYHRSRAG